MPEEKPKYQHAEAFCLMRYRCPKCGRAEVIWNSRDGVTPMMVGCPACGDHMQHTDWRGDQCRPDHRPHPNQFVFVDITPEKARLYATRRWDAMPEKYTANLDREQCIAEVVESAVQNREPDMILGRELVQH